MQVPTELQGLLRLERKADETDAAFVERLVRKADKLPDHEWETLSADTQKWVNNAVKAILAKKPVPMLGAVSVDSSEDVGLPAASSKVRGPKERKSARESGVKAKASMTEKTASGRPWGRKGKFPEGAKIVVLSKENPFRKGTKCYAWFGALKTGMTIPEAAAAGVPRNHIRWAHTLGHIKI